MVPDRNRPTMTPPEPEGTTEAAIVRLERQITELRNRVAELERRLGARGDHPADDVAVRRKVAYDWQS